MDLLVQDLFALADATGTDEFSVVAESFGGSVALLAVLEQPHRIERLCLMSTPCCGAEIKPLQAWAEMTRSAMGMARWHEEMMASRFAEGSVATEALNWFASTQQQTDAGWLEQMARLIQATDLRGRLSKVSAPVLLIAGDSSPYVGMQQVVELHAQLPDSQVCIFPGARHGIAFSHARACAERFLAFAAGYRGVTSKKETV
jgi:2-hydroxy-6-oxo-octa-2,4-dienoate hydrolase